MREYLTALIILISINVHGQGILVSSDHPDMISLCRESYFTYQIENLDAVIFEDVQLTLDMPAGMKYVPGSSQMMIEIDISNTNEPIFELNDLMVGSTMKVSFKVTTNCELYSDIQMGMEFQNDLRFVHRNFDFTYMSDSYAINPALLVITELEDQDATTNTTFTREIEISNGRLGRLSEFIFVDSHESVRLTSAAGEILNETDQLLRLRLGGDDFENIGNGDRFFDLDESIVIEEIIMHDQCEAESLNSEIMAYWGCDGQICQADTGYAEIDLSPTTGRARLRTEGVGDFPDCPCLPGGYRQCMVFENIGDASTDNLMINLFVSSISNITYGGLEGSIAVDSGNAMVLDVLYDSLRPIACSNGNNIFSRAEIFLTDVAPGEKVKVCFDLQPCFERYPAMGGTVQFQWSYGYEHETACKPFSRVRRPNIPVDLLDTTLLIEYEFLGSDKNLNLFEDSTYLFKWNVSGQSLREEGRLLLEVCLPCGYYALDDIELSTEMDLIEHVTKVDDTSTLIQYWYRLPIDTHQISAHLPLSINCSEPCVLDLGVPQSTDYYTSCDDPESVEREFGGLICGSGLITKCPTPLDCGFEHEYFVSGKLKCPESTEIDTVKAYVEFEGETSRVNFGKNDDDDDRHADLGQPSQFLTDERKVVINDTILSQFRGTAIVDDPSLNWDSLVFRVGLTLPIEFLLADFKFKDVESGQEFTCRIDSATFLDIEGAGAGCCQLVITERSGYVIQLDITEELLSRSGCLIPDFHLTMGDSIWCDIYMRNPNHTAVELRYNFTQSSLLFSTESDEHVLFSCDRIGTPFFFSGMVLNLYPYESLKVDVCGRNESSGSWKFYPTELMDNFFEHEFRQLIELSQLTIEVPKEFQVDSVELEVTYRKDFIDTDTIVEGLDVYFDGFVYRVDSSELKKLEFDEGFYTDIRPFIKLKDCSAGPSGEDLEAKLELSVRGVNGFEFAVIPITSTPWKEFDFASTRDIEIDYPEIELEFGPPTISANTEEFCRSIRWQQSEKVEYLTISTELFKEDGAKIVVTESGGLELEEVIQGRFVADNVERGVYFFDVCVESDTCVDDSLFVDLSWSCVSDTNAIETCYDSAFVFEIKKENAELELDIQSESQVELCDTSEYIYISVINGDLGRAYDNRLYVILPMGFSFLPDDIEVQYPTGSQWRSLGLPKLFSGNIFYWELDNVITSADGGLPGLDSVPDNKINIRMKLLSSCDLATGRVVTYWTEGSNPCGSMTNTVRKSTRPFRVEGLDQRFQSVIDLDLDRDNCGGSVLMRFEMTTNQMTMGGELVEIVIPGSLMYDSLSMVGIQNVLSHEPDILDFGGMRILTFFLDRAIDASEKVIFEITLSGIESVNCGDHVITGSVKSVAEAICVATSMPCETFVENGSDDIVLTKQGVDISIDSTLVFDSLDSKFLKSFLNFPEIDDTTGLQYSLTIFRDNELTGVLDTMDVILLDTNIVANVENGSSFNCFDLGPDPGCDWLMIIEGGCVCTPDTISLQHTDIQEFSYCDTICQGDSIWIGRPLSSNTVFQWRSDHELCDTCDQQWVKPDNGTDSIRMFVYEQRISSAESCEESHRYKVVVVPTPPYFQDTILACPGNTVLLATRKPADWTGEGIDQSNKRSIEVNRAGKYQAVYYDEYGCLVYHDFLVDYFVLSNYEIIMDTTIAPGDSIQLWIDPVPDSVIWHPKDGLSCTSCPAPWASPDTTTTYRATVIDDNGCLIELELTLRTAFPPCAENVYVPNVFSPNGDKINDTWRVLGNHLDRVFIVVYDRWGEEVFRTEDPHQAWDGTFNGEFLKPDVFAYAITVYCIDGERLFLKGNLTLVR